MPEDMSSWCPRQRPDGITLRGQYVDIVPLSTEKHSQQLFDASRVVDANTRFKWLPEMPPTQIADFRCWVTRCAVSDDPLFSAVIDKTSGKVAGRQALMRIDADNGVVEIGNIYWGPLIARKRSATEAFFLAAKYVFDDLGYRRFEWKCNDENVPSKNAALRFGFQYEGTFRQHLIVKGFNRDTAWFSMIDKDWPSRREAFEVWLDPLNFDVNNGNQKKRLQECFSGSMVHKDT